MCIYICILGLQRVIEINIVFEHTTIYIHIYYQQMYIYIYRHNISIYIYTSVTCLYMFKWNISFQLIASIHSKTSSAQKLLGHFKRLNWELLRDDRCRVSKTRDHYLLRNMVFNCQKQTYHVHKFLSIKYYINILYIKIWHQTLVTSKKKYMGLQMGSNFAGKSSTMSSNRPLWSLRHGVSLALGVSWERLQVGFFITLVVVASDSSQTSDLLIIIWKNMRYQLHSAGFGSKESHLILGKLSPTEK